MIICFRLCGRILTLWACSSVLLLLSSMGASAGSADFIVVSRLSERLIVAFAGLFSLWMGYRLFRAIGEGRGQIIAEAGKIAQTATELDPAASPSVKQGHFEAKLGDIVNVKMMDVGPGIFFALFGALLLGYVMSSTVSIGGSSLDDRPSMKFGLSEPQHLLTSEKAAKLVRAIRTLRAYSAGNANSEDARRKYQEALGTLAADLPDLVDQAVGLGAYSTFERVRIAQLSDPASFAKISESERKTYEEVDQLLNGGM